MEHPPGDSASRLDLHGALHLLLRRVVALSADVVPIDGATDPAPLSVLAPPEYDGHDAPKADKAADLVLDYLLMQDAPWTDRQTFARSVLAFLSTLPWPALGPHVRAALLTVLGAALFPGPGQPAGAEAFEMCMGEFPLLLAEAAFRAFPRGGPVEALLDREPRRCQDDEYFGLLRGMRRPDASIEGEHGHAGGCQLTAQDELNQHRLREANAYAQAQGLVFWDDDDEDADGAGAVDGDVAMDHGLGGLTAGSLHADLVDFSLSLADTDRPALSTEELYLPRRVDAMERAAALGVFLRAVEACAGEEHAGSSLLRWLSDHVLDAGNLEEALATEHGAHASEVGRALLAGLLALPAESPLGERFVRGSPGRGWPGAEELLGRWLQAGGSVATSTLAALAAVGRGRPLCRSRCPVLAGAFPRVVRLACQGTDRFLRQAAVACLGALPGCCRSPLPALGVSLAPMSGLLVASPGTPAALEAVSQLAGSQFDCDCKQDREQVAAGAGLPTEAAPMCAHCALAWCRVLVQLVRAAGGARVGAEAPLFPGPDTAAAAAAAGRCHGGARSAYLAAWQDLAPGQADQRTQQHAAVALECVLRRLEAGGVAALRAACRLEDARPALLATVAGMVLALQVSQSAGVTDALARAITRAWAMVRLANREWALSGPDSPRARALAALGCRAALGTVAGLSGSRGSGAADSRALVSLWELLAALGPGLWDALAGQLLAPGDSSPDMDVPLEKQLEQVLHSMSPCMGLPPLAETAGQLVDNMRAAKFHTAWDVRQSADGAALALLSWARGRLALRQPVSAVLGLVAGDPAAGTFFGLVAGQLCPSLSRVAELQRLFGQGGQALGRGLAPAGLGAAGGSASPSVTAPPEGGGEAAPAPGATWPVSVTGDSGSSRVLGLRLAVEAAQLARAAAGGSAEAPALLLAAAALGPWLADGPDRVPGSAPSPADVEHALGHCLLSTALHDGDAPVRRAALRKMAASPPGGWPPLLGGAAWRPLLADASRRENDAECRALLAAVLTAAAGAATGQDDGRDPPCGRADAGLGPAAGPAPALPPLAGLRQRAVDLVAAFDEDEHFCDIVLDCY
ncbi:hypothetical protein H696_02598 [Fonticula alba]|uniref:Uncharacterized protein n=1 Tax=Fonticula alba TaxID=691883 RepID=A0A058Z8L7_FONAL|nr:hypothetical protein H696_02598 [Fonticula alba]KCV70268.1 hypothetical protein H696_02598 [Fonticula alba]|eukprot:XP_009494784.1 hypothetical protein H696_02598 [Fonticula alba]